MNMEGPHKKADAIVFIPGIFRSWEGSVVEGLGERLVVALEWNSPSRFRFQMVLPTNACDGGER